MDKTNDNAITYTSGSLENPAMSKYVTDVLEGTRWAFEIRGNKYNVNELGPVNTKDPVYAMLRIWKSPTLSIVTSSDVYRHNVAM